MKIEKTNLFTFSELSEKEKRNLEILALVANKGLISRTDLSRETGINIVSISNYIKNHIEKKLVFDAGQDVSTGGRKPELVEINNRDNCVVGVDIGNSEIRLTLTDLAVKTIARSSILREKTKDNEMAADIGEAVKKLMSGQSIPGSALRAIGISVPDNGLVPPAQELEALAGASVFTGDRATCSAFGERQLNKSADNNRMLYMHSDLGKGVVIIKDTFICAGDPDNNDFEENASRYLRPWDYMLSIVANAKREVTKGIGTDIVKLSAANADNITEEIVISAARQNDEVASIILQNVGINLGLRISYLVNLFAPKVVVIGGGVESSGDIILGTIRKMVDRLAFAKQAKAISIIPGVLGSDAAGLGAAALAIREVFLNA